MRGWIATGPLALAYALCGSTAAQEAEEEKENPLEHVRLGATLEGYYEYNANRPHDRINLLRAYDPRANSFGIQQATLVLESAVGVDAGRRYGARLDLQFGQATDVLQGSPANEPRPETWRNVWQAYGTYVFDLGNGLTADFGKWASNLGLETNYAKDNMNFSRAYLFNFLPYYHMGLRLAYPITGRLTAMYTLVNGIQQTDDFNDHKSQLGALIWKPTDRIVWTANYYVGQEQPDGGLPDGPNGYFKCFDTYASWTATDALSFGLDLNHTTNEVTVADRELSLDGIGAYARWQVSSPFALALRYEHLDDDGLFGGVDQTLQEATLTAEYKPQDGFLVRAELRRDWSDQNFFTGSVPGDLREEQDTALVGFVWWFGNKKGAW